MRSPCVHISWKGLAIFSEQKFHLSQGDITPSTSHSGAGLRRREEVLRRQYANIPKRGQMEVPIAYIPELHNHPSLFSQETLHVADVNGKERTDFAICRLE